MVTDTQRLNWVIDHILFDYDVRSALHISEEDLTCPGNVSLGEQIRKIIDNRLHQTPTSFVR